MAPTALLSRRWLAAKPRNLHGHSVDCSRARQGFSLHFEAEPGAVHHRWNLLSRELEIAAGSFGEDQLAHFRRHMKFTQVSIGDTDRIRAALDNTEHSGICQARDPQRTPGAHSSFCEEQLQPGVEALAAFKRSDAAMESLAQDENFARPRSRKVHCTALQAMDSCDAELIHQALLSACQDNVTDSVRDPDAAPGRQTSRALQTIVAFVWIAKVVAAGNAATGQGYCTVGPKVQYSRKPKHLPT